MKTLHPEADIIASRAVADGFIYTVRKGAATVDVRVPLSAFAGVLPGRLGVQPRREIVGRAVREAV